jgi:hypothetical protein
MKIKFNWGTGIVLAMIVMIGGMIFLVSIALRQDYDLVENDYYQKSVEYQKHIDEVRNTEALVEKVRFEQTGDSLTLTFPALASVQDFSGEIHFYSPVEEKRDETVKLKLNSQFIQAIGLKNLRNGRYTVKLNWAANKKSYYQEQEITVRQ